jgi:hypothetical protein
MRSLSATASSSESLGYFRVFAKPPGGVRREITIFRGAPIIVENASFSDPFTHTTASIALPQVTVFDNPGEGDLDWLVADSDIDIVWQNTGPYAFNWSWEGFITSMDFGISGTDSTYRIDLKGALYGLDDYLAIPSFPRRPIPYEILVAKAFDQIAHPAHLGQFRVLFPTWWQLTVPEYNDPQYLSFLKPWGVATGQPWTGFTSRSTGSWEPLLTGHVQSLLSVMFAEGGAQWSVRNRGQRRPELYLREIPEDDDPEIIEINLGAPGIEFNGSRDYSQRASVIYGQGVDDAGVSYSGIAISPDGGTTTYEPFAFSPTVWPRISNPRYDSNVKAKEVMVRFQDGVDELSARKIAQGQFQRFSEPGITGSITLRADVRYADGYLCPRMLIRAGQTLRINGIYGLREGVLAHVTQVQADFNALSVTLDYDTKYRDALTVEEVKARTRDALTPLRALQIGKYSNTVQDLVLPWSYKEGSGVIPLGAKEFFTEKLPATAKFPYEEWTKAHPPSNPAYAPYYVRLNPTDQSDSSNNWSGVAREGYAKLSIPIRMSQNGNIRLSQIAAYDKDGNVKKVRFHVSVYGNPGMVGADGMPRFPSAPANDPSGAGVKFLHPENIPVSYAAGQANPFFENAWETVKEDGTAYEDDNYLPAEGTDLIIGWGNYFEPAGYSPGRFSRGAERTGLLIDDTQWNFDTTTATKLDLIDPSRNADVEYAGMVSVMIYCDEQGSEPVYFMGRFFRAEPGQQS